jgi:hypothetical protein
MRSSLRCVIKIICRDGMKGSTYQVNNQDHLVGGNDGH